MKVILQQDVKGKGKKGQLVEVSDGYARNFLLPHKLAVVANADNVNTMKLQEQARREQEAKERAVAQALSQRLKNCPVKLSVKSGAGGRLFGSITAKEIAEGLNAQHGISINKAKLVLEEPIKTCGTFEVKCKLGYEITGVLKVVITEA